MQPSSASCPKVSSDVVRFGSTCAVAAVADMLSIGSEPVCVELNLVSSGRETCIDEFVVGFFNMSMTSGAT